LSHGGAAVRYRLAVDGACAGNPGPGGWAVLLTRPDGTENLVSGAVEHATNNAMEIMAVVEGLRNVPEDVDVEVETDSALVIGWLTHGWRRNHASLRPLLEDADALIATRRVRFVKVRGHAGDPRNELVNAHAEREAAEAASRMGKP
jgi:ribonuclease HI